MWPRRVKDEVLVACGRHCSICHRFCGVKIELHHIEAESDGGASDVANCIPLCFDCHADVGHYNPRHPKGTKYSPAELRGHRDRWFSLRERVDAAMESNDRKVTDSQPLEAYEGQKIKLSGFIWGETFPGPPNYESLKTDNPETYWMFVLQQPIDLLARSPEDGSTLRIPGVQKLQLNVDGDFYEHNRSIVLTNAEILGKLSPSWTGHHHGDANFHVIELLRADA
jgi:hypothetical protein